jgi:GxxExxY protein
MLYESVTRSVIGAAYEVYDRLGSGFHESVDQKARAVEFTARGLHFEREAPIPLFFRESDVGDDWADFVVEDCVIVETKAVVSVLQGHSDQLLNYLRVSHKEVGLLLNFGARTLGIVRKVWTRRGDELRKEAGGGMERTDVGMPYAEKKETGAKDAEQAGSKGFRQDRA